MALISFDPAKRRLTLVERGLDFAEAETVFKGPTFDQIDDRREYGETRYVTIGHLRGRMVVIVWTPRNGAQHVISMRKANGKEQARYQTRLGGPG